MFSSTKRLIAKLTSFQAASSSAIPIQEQRHFLVPDLLSNTFSGRDDILTCIFRSLHGRQTEMISRAALWGIPGIGKTQIALRFANRYRSEYTNVFYVNASSPETIAANYRAILRTLRPNKPVAADSDKLEIQELFNMCLAENPNWLLIYDNAIRPAAVRGYTPIRGSGHIVFTTRNVVAAEQLVERENAYEVLALPMTQAIPFILRLQKITPPAPQEEQLAQRLAQAVMGLPIAIEQTVLLARLRRVSVAEIIPDFEKRRDKRRALLKQSHPASMHEEECSIGALVTMTLDTLSAASQQAASLFRLLVYFDTSSIPIAFLTSASTELQHHFARQETYDRGLIPTVAGAKENKSSVLDNAPFNGPSPLEKDFWRSRGPFRSKTPVSGLPRIDTDSDRAVERFYKGDRLLQDVLEKDIRIENALLDLKGAGLIRRLNDKTIWIHDLFAQLTIATIEEESLAISQTTAHLVLLVIYLSFPIPDLSRSRDPCLACLPHATCILTYCAPFYKNLTMGPELAHLTASALDLNSPGNKSPEYREKLVKYYKLAIVGYHYAWGRLRSIPGITEKEIMLSARAEYAQENAKLLRHIHALHSRGYERFGSSPAPRSVQTLLKLGNFYASWEQYTEAVNWTTMAVRGFKGLYGELHDETMETRGTLLYLYKEMHDFGKGYALSRLMVMDYMKRWGGGLVCEPGASLAVEVGDCAMGLGRVQEAGDWYQVTLRGMTATFGDEDRTLIQTLLRLVRVERLQHNHGSSLQYALRAEKVYHAVKRSETDLEILVPENLTPIQLAIALQHFERGNSEAAREWCEKTFVGPKWTPLKVDRPSNIYRTLCDVRLEAIWIWGCVEYGEADVQEWEISAFNIAKDLSREALSRFGPLKNPCCGGVDRGRDGHPKLSVAAELQGILKELDDLDRTS